MNNFIIRTLSGIVFVAAIVGGILYGPLTFCLLFAAITVVSTREFYTLVNTRGDVQTNRSVGTVAGLYLFAAFAAFCTEATNSSVFIPYLLMLIYILISELYLKAPNPLNNWVYAFAGQLYVALPFALLNILAFQHNPQVSMATFTPIYPLAIFIFLWANDSGAYCVGSLLHHKFPAKLFERISPNKSWIGSIGGVAIVVLVALVLAQFDHSLSVIKWVGFGLVVSIFGTWGDLVESLIKRHLKIKDSGHFLPGHGGALDRFDSALLAIPATILYLYTLSMF